MIELCSSLRRRAVVAMKRKPNPRLLQEAPSESETQAEAARRRRGELLIQMLVTNAAFDAST